MAISILEVTASNAIPSFAPFGVLYYAQDTGDLWIGTGFSTGSDYTPGNPGPNVNKELIASGGGGTPGGFNGDIQYNNLGAFGGSAATVDALGNINALSVTATTVTVVSSLDLQTAVIVDSVGSTGTIGQALESTGTGILWATVTGGGTSTSFFVTATIGTLTATVANIVTATVTNDYVTNDFITTATITTETISNSYISTLVSPTATITTATITGANIVTATVTNDHITNAFVTTATITTETISNSYISTLVSPAATITTLTATTATITTLTAPTLTTTTLSATTATVSTLLTAPVITNTTLTSVTATVSTLLNTPAAIITTATIGTDHVTAGIITTLTATTATITTGNIATLVSPAATITTATITNDNIANAFITTATVTSTLELPQITSTPALLSFGTASSGTSSRIALDGNSVGLQSAYGDDTQIYSYWPLQILGNRQNTSVPAFVSGSSSASAVIVSNTQAAVNALQIDGATSQSAPLLILSVTGTTVFEVDAKGRITEFNGSPTAGAGVPSEQFAIINTALSANYNAGSAKTVFTPTTNTILRINVFQGTQQAATSSSTFPSLTLGWTDSSGQARTITLITTSAANTVNVQQNAVVCIATNSSTPVTITSASYASSGGTAMEYMLAVSVEAL